MSDVQGQEIPEVDKTDSKRPLPRDLEKFPAVYKKHRNLQPKRL